MRKLFACVRARSTPNCALQPPPRSASACTNTRRARKEDVSDLPRAPEYSETIELSVHSYCSWNRLESLSLLASGRFGTTDTADFEISAASWGESMPHFTYPSRADFSAAGSAQAKAADAAIMAIFWGVIYAFAPLAGAFQGFPAPGAGGGGSENG